MEEEEKQKKQLNLNLSPEMMVLVIILAVLGIVTVIGLIFDKDLFGPGNSFAGFFSDNSVINYLHQKIPAMVRTCQILFIALVLFVVLKWIAHNIKSDSHFLTAIKLIISFSRYAVFIVAIVAILTAWGVDTQTMLVSAGILGLIIGLGAQSLIADIIAGMFIVFDGEYKVGDIIVVDGWRGTVMEIGIRTTKIIDAGGNIKYINNSTIKAVVNQSQELSVITVTLNIFYDENLERVEQKIMGYLPKIANSIPMIVEGPYYKGLNAMSDSSVDLLFLAKCKEDDFYPARRALNREVYIMAYELGIQIPYPQVVVNQPYPEGTFDNSPLPRREQRKVEEFVYGQAVLSRDMESENE